MTTCHICSSPQVKDLYNIKGTQLSKCHKCGVVFVHPQPGFEDLRRDYQEEYFQSSDHLEWGYEDYFSLEDEVRATARERLKIVMKHIRGGRLLEPGCATGWFLDEARSEGFEVQGVELSDFAAEWGREKLRLPIVTGTLAEAGLADGGYDAVALWDVLEHLTDPVSELGEVNRVLKTGGYLFLSVPNIGSFWARALGKRWFGFAKVKEHLFYYDKSSLALALDNAGFDVIELRPSPFLLSLRFLVSKTGQYSGTLARLLEKALTALHLQDKRLKLNIIDLMAVARKR